LNIKAEYFFQVILPLLLGSVIYLLFREKILATKLFYWISEPVFSIRSSNQTGAKDFLFKTFVGSLPNALWVFSFTRLYLLIWRKKKKLGLVWFFLAFFVSILLEIGQYFGFIIGTFDLIDLVLVVIAGLLSLLLSIPEITKNSHGKKT